MAAGEPAAERAAMAQAASQVEAAVTAICGLRSSMAGHRSALAGGWTGQAATAFGGAYEAFSADFAQVLNALQAMRDELARARPACAATRR